VSQDHLPRDDYVSLGRVEACLTLCGAIKDTKCMEYKAVPYYNREIKLMY